MLFKRGLVYVSVCVSTKISLYVCVRTQWIFFVHDCNNAIQYNSNKITSTPGRVQVHVFGFTSPCPLQFIPKSRAHCGFQAIDADIYIYIYILWHIEWFNRYSCLWSVSVIRKETTKNHPALTKRSRGLFVAT